MPKYKFASVRGSDFVIEGDDAYDSYEKLQKREEDEGTLWRMNDFYRNRFAVRHEGYSYIDKNDITVGVYKEIEDEE